ncbi:unnamed protein product [Macrosiphum euphorbiae]|uniref:Uncharacterized protein n=1 Tax=Macrosiphum euphorbiae TaxID=13131 RepID=A0AAV0WTH4_9HEMI|nr:unnamed protein product [Macrosiphum euphorbiae]
MQKIWQTRVDWDATLPTEIEGEWRKCRANLIHLNTLKITRSLVGDGDMADIQLHGFADASLTAYGACLYLRVKNYNGEVITNLICSKSRVAPLKTISLPRLELLAAVLLVRLAAKYATSLFNLYQLSTNIFGLTLPSFYLGYRQNRQDGKHLLHTALAKYMKLRRFRSGTTSAPRITRQI